MQQLVNQDGHVLRSCHYYYAIRHADVKLIEYYGDQNVDPTVRDENPYFSGSPLEYAKQRNQKDQTKIVDVLTQSHSRQREEERRRRDEDERRRLEEEERRRQDKDPEQGPNEPPVPQPPRPPIVVADNNGGSAAAIYSGIVAVVVGLAIIMMIWSRDDSENGQYVRLSTLKGKTVPLLLPSGFQSLQHLKAALADGLEPREPLAPGQYTIQREGGSINLNDDDVKQLKGSERLIVVQTDPEPRLNTQGGTEVEIRDVPGDNHCFFHAVTLLLETLPDPYRGLAETLKDPSIFREELVGWMRDHLDDVMYEQTTLREAINNAEVLEGRGPNADVDMYLTRMQFCEDMQAWAGTCCCMCECMRSMLHQLVKEGHAFAGLPEVIAVQRMLRLMIRVSSRRWPHGNLQANNAPCMLPPSCPCSLCLSSSWNSKSCGAPTSAKIS